MHFNNCKKNLSNEINNKIKLFIICNFYKVVFNGTPDKFLEVMSYQNYDFEIKNKIWVLNDGS